MQTDAADEDVEMVQSEPAENFLEFQLLDGLLLRVPQAMVDRLDIGHFKGLLELAWTN